MYGALWRVLPGPWWVRLIILLALIAAVVWALFTWVFPWVDGIVNPIEVTVNQ
ncbi:hypothetical protein [Agromyces archimandritae]|uniref:DUF4175 domain-containing protein n=1 Tax=Agromyces archimandritae TaxID=2781962 RepID=A0A975FP53_9MICO|nr:hypothetical protein [Agromyces archimandritae]QTX06033.1 hypothetical protein G127AT_07595 [Agromyces archimandritae]